ncbi:response regulator transcription factor [Luteolibacter luteus]|uniref:Response regulator transcription factor n=1 Tax=Luteolibacter luteus TaxID=2728835 RepID=A0A858RHD6_9BACT|nr:response regulator transcription factor [Luteolibacter luteus]QJE95680.1 response regulator transcription factor [Luteolibacter luteus]
MISETIHLLDDEAGMRKALSRLLHAEGYDVRAFASPQEFLSTCNASEIGCLLLDVAMPGLDGIELQRRLVRAGARFPIIFLTGHGDIPMTVRAVQAGAVDFLTKPVDETHLLRAVKRALEIAAEQKEERDETARAAARFSRLTPREREVMECVVAGKPNKLIAVDLGTCEQTVKVHRGRVMEKMGAESLADLIRFADRLNIGKKAASSASVN